MTKLILAIVAIAVGVFILFSLQPDDSNETPITVTPSAETSGTDTSFAWRFEEAETNNLDGNPQTNVFVVVTHSTGLSFELVDTVDGGCSELADEKYEGDVSNTGKVQCYSAGLGQQYKITESEAGYSVERKLFEEALPNTESPDYEWEVIKEISL